MFEFLIKRELIIDANNCPYYLIEDSFNSKFLIPKKQYAHYGFVPGDKIKCFLDRINCDGEIFFEPVNPYYSEGKSYGFQFIQMQTITNSFGYPEQVALVKDVFGMVQTINNANTLEIRNEEIKAVVVFIKKGKLFLVPEYLYSYKLCSNYQCFTIKEEIVTERFDETFLLQDSFRNYHFLPKAYYKNYNLKVGDQFHGRIVKYSSKGFFYIEPKHPNYTIGLSYSFTVSETLFDNGSWFAIVVDKNNQLHKVKIIDNQLKTGTEVLLKVNDILKGTLELSFQ